MPGELVATEGFSAADCFPDGSAALAATVMERIACGASAEGAAEFVSWASA
jgi:hypothetical protein